MRGRFYTYFLSAWLILLFTLSCQKEPAFVSLRHLPDALVLNLPDATFKIDSNFHINLKRRETRAKFIFEERSLPNRRSFFSLEINNRTVRDFKWNKIYSKLNAVHDSIGSGKQILLQGKSASTALLAKIQVKAYPFLKNGVVVRVSVQNQSRDSSLTVSKWTGFEQVLVSNSQNSPDDSAVFWAFQGASYPERPDWILPLKKDFQRENSMGMNAVDYGGGIPVLDVWSRQAGFTLAHLATHPLWVSFPVRVKNPGKISLAFSGSNKIILPPRGILTLPPMLLAVHKGDYFNGLVAYRRVMNRLGFRVPRFPKSAYEPVWCAWGYERNFTPNEVLRTLPEVKKLGISWVVLDDGWQIAEGDWRPNPQKFPHGDTDMKALVDSIHALGLKAKLWWMPIGSDPGTPLVKNHPEWLMRDKQGKGYVISWWDSYYLCPINPGVQNYIINLVQKFIGEWGFDGLKVDGQCLNAVPRCFSSAHHHKSPEEPFEKLPQFFSIIYQTATSIKPDAVVEICPCGTCASFFNMPFMNQPVASDPLDSWQIRLKGKTYKALMGANVPYYGDHVELSDGGNDFASTIGIGGVPGSKFTWPTAGTGNSLTRLTPEKERVWNKWFSLYRKLELPRGRYLNLYDIAFESPETHVIQKGDTLFYALFTRKANQHFRGRFIVKGLTPRQKYRIEDYENKRDLGIVQGGKVILSVEFIGHLLLKAEPISASQK